ncbi:LysR family transcriptional regulator [Aquimarina aquimarini]|uniref:LysR family transcriptional regulator n=1 Tax=Aquimarina aquimarini TaxID=1191734 RepID=UPI000D55AFF5|nr:LysR family transcriptional regulator [Aquimarina aquimarini]
MNISLKNLKLVNVIVKEGSITRASEKLFLSQPALSHQLKKLEEELGLKVFNRINKKLVLTETGQILFNTSEKILVSFIQLNNQIEEVKNGKKRSIRITTECYTTYHWLSKVVEGFRKENENIAIDIVIEATKEPLKYLLEGKIDLAIVSTMSSHPSIHFQPVVQDEMMVVMARENNLAHHRIIDLPDLIEQNLILYDLPEEKNYVLTHILQNNKETVKSIQKVQLTEAIIQLVRANLGITIMAKWALDPFLQDAQLKVVPFKSTRGMRTWYTASLNKTSELEMLFAAQIKIALT